jgi:putative tryptophan/tyrosine transport system substrate-binding protein
MRRREFVTLLVGAAALPLAAHAQQPGRLRTIAFLGPNTHSAASEWVAALVKRLRELGWTEGRTITIEYRWAEGREERFAEIAAELVRLKADVIVTSGTQAVMASKNATSVIPIVFATAGDPVGSGLVGSLARPAGNVTGLATLANELVGKRLELLREIVPGLRRVAIMGNVANPYMTLELGEVQAAARTLGLETITLEIRRAQDLAPAFEALKSRADALYVCTDALTNTHRIRINIAALGERLPTMHGSRDFVEAGGLMSYGPNFPDMFRRTADYVDKILRGAKPGDLPVEQPTKFDLVVNLTTAKALRLDVPATLLTRTDEVIDSRWHGGRAFASLAAFGACAAVGEDPAYRHHRRLAHLERVSARLARPRLCGGSEHCFRVSLRRWDARSAGVGRGGAGPTPGRPHRDVWYGADACGQAGDDDDPHRHDGSW